MPAINFPSSPSINQVHTANGKTFVWDGSSWVDNTFRSISNLDIQGVLSEKVEISNSAPSGTILFDAINYSTLYNTTPASSSWVVNIRGNSSTTLNTLMDVDTTLTIVHLVNVGETSYLPSSIQVDGVATTILWQGSSELGSLTNSLVAYTYTIIKTAANTYSVFGSQVKFTDEMVTTTTTSGGV